MSGWRIHNLSKDWHLHGLASDSLRNQKHNETEDTKEVHRFAAKQIFP